MTNRISTLISVLGVLTGALLLFVGVREYRSGGPALWAGLGVLIFLSAVWTLVRDVRRAGRKSAAG